MSETPSRDATEEPKDETALKLEREGLLAELLAVEGEQARIDVVAEDVYSGRCRYAQIDAYDLAAALGVCYEDAADGRWGHRLFAYRVSLENGSEGQPFAEHVELLAGLIPAARHAVLLKEAEQAIEQAEGEDIRLSEKEEQLLREAYQRAHGASCLTRSAMTLTASDGSELEFYCTLSDGYWDGSAWGPYDECGFDESDYVEIE